MSDLSIVSQAVQKLENVAEQLNKYLRTMEPNVEKRVESPLFGICKQIEQIQHELSLLKQKEPQVDYELRCVDCNEPIKTYVGLDCCGSCYDKRIWGDR